jgi:hypothetical protein
MAKVEIDELTKNIWKLSCNTRLKHRLVDAAVMSSGLALFATIWLIVVLLGK